MNIFTNTFNDVLRKVDKKRGNLLEFVYKYTYSYWRLTLNWSLMRSLNIVRTKKAYDFQILLQDLYGYGKTVNIPTR